MGDECKELREAAQEVVDVLANGTRAELVRAIGELDDALALVAVLGFHDDQQQTLEDTD